MKKSTIALALLLALAGCDAAGNLQWAGTWGNDRTPAERRADRPLPAAMPAVVTPAR